MPIGLSNTAVANGGRQPRPGAPPAVKALRLEILFCFV